MYGNINSSPFDVPIIEGEVEVHKGFLELSATLGGAEYALYIISWDILVRLERTRVSKLAGLEDNIIPIEPMTISMSR